MATRYNMSMARKRRSTASIRANQFKFKPISELTTREARDQVRMLEQMGREVRLTEPEISRLRSLIQKLAKDRQSRKQS
ncbi:MAG: hypothetical protein Q7S21_07195 [archaeon]|nr:hypothetical protein [archaeon]